MKNKGNKNKCINYKKGKIRQIKVEVYINKQVIYASTLINTRCILINYLGNLSPRKGQLHMTYYKIQNPENMIQNM